jgi:hypothetical protein
VQERLRESIAQDPIWRQRGTTPARQSSNKSGLVVLGAVVLILLAFVPMTAAIALPILFGVPWWLAITIPVTAIINWNISKRTERRRKQRRR